MQDHVSGNEIAYSILALTGVLVRLVLRWCHVSIMQMTSEAYWHRLKGLVLLQVFIVAFSLGTGAIPWIIMSEVLLPPSTQVKCVCGDLRFLDVTKFSRH